MSIKYFIQLPTYTNKDDTKSKARQFLDALENMKEEQFLMFAGDDIKIYPYDPDTDEVIVTSMKLEDAVRIWKEQYNNKKQQVN